MSTTKTFQEGINSVVVPDSFLDSGDDQKNHGASTVLSCGYMSTKIVSAYRSILEFPLSDSVDSIPADATIESAKLTLTPYAVAASAENAVVYRVVRTNWVELEVTWSEYKFAFGWTTAGCGDDGNDYTSVNSASWTLPTSLGTFDITGLAGIVQDALSDGEVHLLLRRTTETAPEAYFRFYSSEWGTGSMRPKLTVTYSTGIPVLGRRRRQMV